MLPVIEREVPLRMTRHVQHLDLPTVPQSDSLPAREAHVHLARLARVRGRLRIEAHVVLLLEEVVAAVIKGGGGLRPSGGPLPPPPPHGRREGVCGRTFAPPVAGG